jgi:phenylacetate-CoA ligase
MTVAVRTPVVEHLHTLAGLWRHPHSSRGRLVRFQSRKLRVLVDHAYRRVPLYRRLFDDAGVRPGDVRSASDLVRLPITTKAEMRRRPVEDLLADGVRAERLILRYTTGSTGEPARIRRTEFEDHLLNAFRIRARRLAGERLRDRTLAIISRGVPTDRKVHSRKRLMEALGVLRSATLDCLQPIEDLARAVRRFAPDVLAGYPAVISEIAGVWPDVRGVTGHPRLVFAGGETMTPAMRRRIERGFQARVVDVYGSHEFNLIGWECAVTGDWHLCDDSVVVEVVRDGRPVAAGETGDVVVTGLHTYAAPFIRYDLGDVATRGDQTCRCGAPFSTLRNLRGRRMDYCVLPDGRKMHHWELIPMSFWDMPWHRRYQLVQEARERFVLRVIADDRPPADDLAALTAAIGATLGPGAAFRIDLVDDLAFPATGKHQLCRSELGASEPAAGSAADTATARP